MSEQAPRNPGFTPDVEQLLAANEQAHADLREREAAEAAAQRAAHNAGLQEAWVGKLDSDEPTRKQLDQQEKTLLSFQDYLKQRPRNQRNLNALDRRNVSRAQKEYDDSQAQTIEDKHPVELAHALKDAIEHDDKTLENDVMAEVKRRAQSREVDGKEFVQYFKDRRKAFRAAKAEQSDTKATAEPASKEARTEDARKAVEEAQEAAKADEPEVEEQKSANKVLPPMPEDKPAQEKAGLKGAAKHLKRALGRSKSETSEEEADESIDDTDVDQEVRVEEHTDAQPEADTPTSDEDVEAAEHDGKESKKPAKVLPPMPEEKPAKKKLDLKGRAKKLIGRKNKDSKDDDQKPEASKPQGLGTRTPEEIKELTKLVGWTDEEIEELQAEYESQIPVAAEGDGRTLVQRLKDLPREINERYEANMAQERTLNQLRYKKANVPRTAKELADLMFDDPEERKAYLEAVKTPEAKRKDGTARAVAKRGLEKAAQAAKERKATVAAQRREGLNILRPADDEEDRAQIA